jgi:hypothetical protein
LLRGYAPLADSGKIVRSERFLGSPGFGRRTYWMREGFDRLNELTSPATTVQYNPVRDEVLIAHLYSARQAVMGDAFCGAAFGGDVVKCRQAFPYVATVFNAPDTVRNWALDRFCDNLGVNVLVRQTPILCGMTRPAGYGTGPLSRRTQRCAPFGVATRLPLRSAAGRDGRDGRSIRRARQQRRRCRQKFRSEEYG